MNLKTRSKYSSGRVIENHNGEVRNIEPQGAGAELKKLLAIGGIKAMDGCGCNAMAAKMNREGVDWCRENIDEILDVMEVSSLKRRLPFSRIGAKAIVLLAIGIARSKEE